MIEQLDAQIYLACSTVPNLNHYDLQISCDPAEDMSKAPTLDPSARKTAIRIFRTAGSDGVSRWYFHSSSSPSILEIEDESFIQMLEANLPAPPEPSEILKAILESSLPLELSSLQMQKDMSSCPAFALHYAIRAGKIENLHEMCARLAESPSPILRRVSDSLSLKNPAFTRIRPVSWHSLPSEFRKWSQSATFQTPAKQGDIFSSMEKKVKKHTVPRWTEVGQTHLERLLGWINKH